MDADPKATTAPDGGRREGGEHESPAALVAALHDAFGAHHARAVHAKGVILEGAFTPTDEAWTLSRASLFAGRGVSATIRFSDFTGFPDIPDAADGANPRGLGIKFHLADGATADVVAHGFNGFPVATADEFARLMRAIGASGKQAPKPTELDAFLGDHPAARVFLTTQKPAPVSYATLAYFGVNAFRFVDRQSRGVHVRYRFAPQAGEHFLRPVERDSRGPDYLREEIAARVAAGPVRFDWFAQIAEAGDPIDDPSAAWPDSRRLVRLGTLRIDRLAADQAAADKALLLLPGNVPSGIEAADPMLRIRDAAYPLSFHERQ